MSKPATVTKLKQMKQEKTPISVLTAYDYPSAKLAEQAGIDAILVGDSLGNVVLGYDTTIPVTMEDMVYHSRAVARGSGQTFIITDMPFMSYHISRQETLRNATRLMQEGHANAIKMEGGEEIAEEVYACVKAGIPVMGHIGLTPQSVHQLGGYKVQGKQEAQAERLAKDAVALEQAGAFSIVLEMVTEPLAEQITESLTVPTIGIGAGRFCDGQVLVYHDILQYASPYHNKRFVKTYANLGGVIQGAIESYIADVKSKAFPEASHAFGVAADETREMTLYGSRKGG